MGTSLYGLTPSGTYPGLIKTGDNTAISGTLKTLSDGNGNNLPMEASTSTINFTGALQQSGVAVPTASQVNAKQDTLVSGTNIKTINGTSVLGSGNIVTPSTSPSGSAGYIQFSNGSAFASDANLFWDNTNKRLGIGTTSPDSKFQVVTSGSTGFRIDIGGSGNGNNYIDAGVSNTGFTFLRCRTETSGPLSVNFVNGYASAMLAVKGTGSTSATTALLVQNSSGTQVLKATDDGKLTIGTNAGNSGALLFQVPGISNGVFWGDDYSQIWGSITLSRSSGEMRIFAAVAGYFQTFYTQGNERMRIDTSGNVGIGTSSPNASSILDVSSTTKGFLPPRMTTAQKNAISSPASGLVVYDTTTNKLCCYNGTSWNDLF